MIAQAPGQLAVKIYQELCQQTALLTVAVDDEELIRQGDRYSRLPQRQLGRDAQDCFHFRLDQLITVPSAEWHETVSRIAPCRNNRGGRGRRGR